MLIGLAATVPILKCLAAMAAVAAMEEKNRVSVAAIAATRETVRTAMHGLANVTIESLTAVDVIGWETTHKRVRTG